MTTIDEVTDRVVRTYESLLGEEAFDLDKATLIHEATGIRVPVAIAERISDDIIEKTANVYIDWFEEKFTTIEEELARKPRGEHYEPLRYIRMGTPTCITGKEGFDQTYLEEGASGIEKKLSRLVEISEPFTVEDDKYEALTEPVKDKTRKLYATILGSEHAQIAKYFTEEDCSCGSGVENVLLSLWLTVGVGPDEESVDIVRDVYRRLTFPHPETSKEYRTLVWREGRLMRWFQGKGHLSSLGTPDEQMLASESFKKWKEEHAERMTMVEKYHSEE